MAAAPKLSRLALSSSSTSLSPCTPNLMPFNIDYNGKAPVSTFFHVGDAKRNVGAPEGGEDEGQNSQDTIVAEEEPSKPQLKSEASQLADTIAKLPLPSTSASSSSSLTTQSEDFPKRFVSTFRGRTIHGLEVQIPEGLTGVLFRSEGDEKAGGGGMLTKGKEKAKSVMKRKGRRGKSIEEDEEPSSSRTTRRSARRASAEDEDMKAPSDDDGFPEDQEPHRTTTLDASMQFSSFVLWHPDIPVDTGKDEYFATISEWMKVAQAINHIED